MSKGHGEARDFSPKTITFGMQLQRLEDSRLLGGLYRAGHDWWAGSDSPSYVPVKWRAVKMVPFEGGAEPVVGAGNPEAGRRPRTYNKAMVIGAGYSAMHDLIRECGTDGLEAIGYEHDGKSYAAPLPDGFGSIVASEEDQFMAAALREAKRPASGMIGMLYPIEGKLIIPRQEIISDLVPVANIAARYPNIPMV
jgi:hypothetical protein